MFLEAAFKDRKKNSFVTLLKDGEICNSKQSFENAFDFEG